jgi:hypothetical protein
MGTFGQLDQHHADVLDHRQHHLPQRFELHVVIEALVGRADGQRLDARHRRDAASEPRGRAKIRFEFGIRARTAVQQGCRHCICTHPQLGDDQGGTDVVGEIRTRSELLVGMGEGAPGKVVFRHRQHAGQG